MGTKAIWNGSIIDSSFLPYEIITKIPLFNILTNIVAMIGFSFLFLGILVSFSILFLEQFIKSKFKNNHRLIQIIIITILFSIIFFEFIPFTIASTEVSYHDQYYNLITEYKIPKIYLQINDTNDFGILSLRYNTYKGTNKTCDFLDSYYLMYQTIHEIPMYNSKLSRVYDSYELKINRESIIENRLKYIIINKECINKSTLKIINQNFKKLFSDQTHIIFQTYS